MSFEEKYKKYKNKYLALKGGRLYDLKIKGEDDKVLEDCFIIDDDIILNDERNTIANQQTIKNRLNQYKRCNSINLNYTENNKFYFYLELESKANQIRGDLFTNLMDYTHIKPKNIFIIYSNINKQKEYFKKRLDNDNLLEFNVSDQNVYNIIQKFIEDKIKEIKKSKINNASIIFDIFTHGSTNYNSMVAINGKNKYISVYDLYNLFKEAYTNNSERVEDRVISDITFITSFCYSSILKNFFIKHLETLKGFTTVKINKVSDYYNAKETSIKLNNTKYINFHFISSLPVNENLLVLGSYLYNTRITTINDFTIFRNTVRDFLINTFAYDKGKADEMINKFISIQTTKNLVEYKKLQNNSTPRGLEKEPGDCSNVFFDIYMATNTSSRNFLGIIEDIALTKDKFILLENMERKLININNDYINWLKNIKSRENNSPSDQPIYNKPNILYLPPSYDTNLGSFVFNLNSIFDNSCSQLFTNDLDLTLYLNLLFKNSFDNMEFYSFLNDDKLKDNDLILKDIF